MNDDPMNVIFSEDDGGYIADTPDLKPSSVFGATTEQVIREVQAAKTAWLETCQPKETDSPSTIPVGHFFTAGRNLKGLLCSGELAYAMDINQHENRKSQTRSR